MTRLTSVRVQVPDALVVHNAEPVTPEQDDAFLIEGITVPAWNPADGERIAAAPSEMLRVSAKRKTGPGSTP